MLEWFEKNAPIRAKFKALTIAYCSLSALSLVGTAYALSGGGNVALAISVAALLITLAINLVSSKLVCTPYVNTVVRMEALADGDTRSPIAYTDHRDCVGRMTKAMSVFLQNAEKVSASAAEQQEVVRSLAQGLKELASGNLTYTISQAFPGEYDQLRQSFNDAVNGLDESLGQVSVSASSVHAGSSEIRSASEDLARRTEQQAATLEETAAATSQVTGMVSESARSVGDVRASINAATRDATEGGKVVRQAVAAMDEIQTSSQAISSIINVIDGIAFQTNLLALNAGVEAARAGEAGKGFAVVASEVRALAQRSADAAQEIKTLITTSGEQVGKGVTMVGETGKMLDAIAAKISEINSVVEEMASSAQNQADNLRQVNGSVSDMDKMTQQNAAMVEETTATARTLASEADELAGLVARFRLSNARPGQSRAHGVRSAPSFQPARAAAAPRMPTASAGSNLAVAFDEDDWAEF